MLNISTLKCLLFSICLHGLILLGLTIHLEYFNKTPVLANSHKNNIINAVALGVTPKSTILTPTKTIASAKKRLAEDLKVQKTVPVPEKQIALKKTSKPKATLLQKREEQLTKDLLADLKKQSEVKRLKQQMLKTQFTKTLREQTEKSLREQLLNEEIRLEGKKNQEAQGEINKYKALILQAISTQWLVPTHADKKLVCELFIRLAPGGTVLDVTVTKSSGDPTLDNSARSAVLKASPLPVPHDSDAFEAFRQFALKVKPENILANDSNI